MPNRAFPRKYDVLFGIAVAAIVIFMILYVNGTILPIQRDYYWAHYGEDIPNPLNRTENLRLLINLNSRTFGAQDNITAYIQLRTDFITKHVVGETLPTYYYWLQFPGSSCYEPIDPYEVIGSCDVYLRPYRFDGSYEGNQTYVVFRGKVQLLYGQGGDFNVILSNSSYTLGEETTVSNDFMKISSNEATNSYYQARDTFVTTRIAVFIAVIAAIIAGFNGYRTVRENKIKQYSSS